VTAVAQAQGNYLETFARFEEGAAGGDQAWLRPVRRAAIARFADLGFPTTRDEDWRFTSVAPIAQTPFRLPRESRADLAPRALEPFAFPGVRCTRLIFVNGRYAPGLSDPAPLPDGVKVVSLARALTADRGALEPHLARYADYHQDAFGALNTAFMEDGAFVWVPRGRILEEPIHLLYVSTPDAAPIMTHPRNLIVVGEEGQAAVVEEYIALGGGIYFSNVVTEVVAGDGSVLEHYMIERESEQAFNVSTLRIQQGRSSNVASHSVLLGGALVRNNIHPVLDGEGGDCLINGLFLATGQQHMDNYMKVEHAKAHCSSRQFYHGVLDGRSRGVFHGRIIVHKDAQKTDAKQTNRNLLLSETAQIDTKPQLEIHADDVKCTHGATIGQINPDAIFYLRSRGIAEEAARALLLFAFAGECLQRMKVEAIRKRLEALVTEWLPRGALLEEIR
jgi:Fe-S cluster assembly protein SufD